MIRFGDIVSYFDSWRRWLTLSALYALFVTAVYLAASHIPDENFGVYLTALILLTLVFSVYFLLPSRWTFIFAPVLTGDRKSTRLNSSHIQKSRMPSSA